MLANGRDCLDLLERAKNNEVGSNCAAAIAQFPRGY